MADTTIRAAAADLAVCEAATPEPWDALDSRHERWHFTAPNGNAPPEGCVEWQILGGQGEGRSSDFGWAVLHGEASRHQIHPKRADLEFIALARTAMPYWIARAEAETAQAEAAEMALIVAKEEIERLQGIVDSLAARVHAQSELLSKKAEKPA